MESRQPQPMYACGLILDERGWLVFEQQPSGARNAAGRLTCFGGRARPHESWQTCLRRELSEELGGTIRWLWPSQSRTIDLYRNRAVAFGHQTNATFHRVQTCSPPIPVDWPVDWIARFVEIPCRLGTVPRVLAERTLLALPPKDWGSPRISPWHRHVITAWRRGQAVTI